MKLSFDLYDNLKFFKVEFETDSRQRNRIMSIEYDGFSLDVIDIMRMHADLYFKIKAVMQERSKEFWDEFDGKKIPVMEIPTLAYQPKSIFLLLFIFLLPLFSPAQFNKPTHFGIFGAQAEYNAKYQKPGAGLFGGYKFNNNYLGLNTHILFGRQRDVPQAIALEYGYSIGNFQPYISYQYFTCGNEAVNVNEGARGFDWGGGISYYPRTVRFKFSLGVNGVKNFRQLKDFTSYSYFSIGYYKNL